MTLENLRCLRPAHLCAALLISLLAACATPRSLQDTPGAVPPPPAIVQPPAPAIESRAPVSAPNLTPPAPTSASAVVPDRTRADAGTVELAPPLPRMRLDPLDDAVRLDLWERLRAGFVIPDIDGELVRKWEQFYAARRDYVLRMTERGGRYLFYIVEEIERRDMPLDLALLPFIESAFNPQAQSSARAAGMWQFMPLTGKDFELRQNIFRDDRRDVLASTRAALDYLQRLYKRFGDWSLALAAYNWGPGNVQRALDRNAKEALPRDYLSLRMPDETRNYVPKLQAIKNIVLRPEAFSLVVPSLANHPAFVSISVERDIDVALVARLSGLTLEEFQQLNPQLNKPVVLAAGTPQLLLPYDNANRFLRAMPLHMGARATWTAWVAPRTLKPSDAARMVGMTEHALREVNRIPPRMLVTVGSTLLVPRAASATANVSEHIADHATMALAPEARAKASKRGKAGFNVKAVRVAKGGKDVQGVTVAKAPAHRAVRAAPRVKGAPAKTTTAAARAKRSG